MDKNEFVSRKEEATQLLVVLMQTLRSDFPAFDQAKNPTEMRAALQPMVEMIAGASSSLGRMLDELANVGRKN